MPSSIECYEPRDPPRLRRQARTSVSARVGLPHAALSAALYFCLGVVVAIAAAGSALTAARAEHGPPKLVTPSEMKSGALLLRASEEGRYVEAPRLGADYDVTVSGPTIRGRVSQIFHNPTEGWVEAVYVYPLSDGAAVDSLKMVVGQRVIVGHIKRRTEAKKIYETAKAAGQKAGLVESERPNLFRNQIANIGPR